MSDVRRKYGGNLKKNAVKLSYAGSKRDREHDDFHFSALGARAFCKMKTTYDA